MELFKTHFITAIHLVCNRNIIEIRAIVYHKCSLCLGADLNAEDRQGQTSLSWACLKGRVAIAQYLLDRGAPLNHADKSGKTALDLATLNGNPALVQVSVKT